MRAGNGCVVALLLWLPLAAFAAGPAEELSVFGHATWELQRHGYVDRNGAVAIPARFHLAGPFSENGLALVEVQGEGVGFINGTGAWAIAPGRFQRLEAFGRNGLAIAGVQVGEQSTLGGTVTTPRMLEGFIDARGKWVVGPRFRQVTAFAGNGLAAAMDDKTGRTGFIDLTGRWVIPPTFARAWAFSDNGLAAAEGEDADDDGIVNGGRYGYIDARGQWAIPPRFRFGYGFARNGLAMAIEAESQKAGYIDRTGAWVLAPAYTDMSHGFSPNGLAAVRLEDNTPAVIDATGRVIKLPPLLSEGFGEQGLAVAWGADGKVGLLDANGRWILPPVFDSIGSRRDKFIDFAPNGLLTVVHEGKARVVDASGTFRPAFDAHTARQRDHAAAVKRAEPASSVLRRGAESSLAHVKWLLWSLAAGALGIAGLVVAGVVLVVRRKR